MNASYPHEAKASYYMFVLLSCVSVEGEGRLFLPAIIIDDSSSYQRTNEEDEEHHCCDYDGN